MTNLQKVKEFAEKYFKDNKDSVHDMDHVLRVYNMVLKLAKNEKVDLEVLKISVLFHDIGKIKEAKDKTGKIDHAIESAKLAKPFLITLGLKESKIQHILDCIISHRHRNNIEPKTLEAKILYDADKIDSIGAVGIAKAFAWIGINNAHIYRKVNISKYIKENMGGKINGKIIDQSKHSHQIEWEVKYKDMVKKLYTKKAKIIARKRLKYHKNFLDKLEREIKGIE